MKKSPPSKQEVIDKCQVQIWKIRRELESYSTLFKGLDLSETDREDLYGTGLALERMAKKLNKINDRLTKIY